MRNLFYFPKPAAWLLAVLAILTLIASLVFYLRAAAFVHSAAHASGTVTDLLQQPDEHSNGTVYYPVYKFCDSHGTEHIIHSGSGSFPPHYSVNQQVTVLYPPDSPDDASLSGYWDLWGIPTILLIVGLGNLVLDGLLILIRRTFAAGS